MTTGTVTLHRVLSSTPDRVYRAFVNAGAFSKWLPPHGFIGTVHEMDPKVGGSYRMSFTNHTNGHSHSFGGTYLELQPGERISYSSTFEDPNLPGEMKTTVTLKKVSAGVDVNIVQEGIPDMIPVDQCYMGWQQSLVLLAQLVEPEINQ
ncbi:MAG: polyketide cyclase [Polaromonas sp.]|nr:polyketide cyclase [Polaromonas sp.]